MLNTDTIFSKMFNGKNFKSIFSIFFYFCHFLYSCSFFSSFFSHAYPSQLNTTFILNKNITVKYIKVYLNFLLLSLQNNPAGFKFHADVIKRKKELRMGMLEAFNLAQTKVLNVINPLKFFQGVGKPSAKMTKFLPKSRKSWSECYKKEEMMHVYTTTKAGFPTMTWMRSSKYSIHYIFSIAGFAAYLNWKVMSMQLQK